MSEVPTRLLRDTLRARTATSPSRECLDAETAAAWADDALAPHERAALEAHAADCASCQALIAALAKTTPPAAPRSWWRMPALGWLVPLAAAAAALVVWVSVPFGTRSAAPARVAATRSEPAASAEVAFPATSAPLERKGETKPVDRRAPQKTVVDESAATKVASAVNAPQAASPQGAPARRDTAQGAAREPSEPAPAQANALADKMPPSAESAAKAAQRPAAPATQPAPAAAAAAAIAAGRSADRAAARMMLDASSRPQQPVIVSANNPSNLWRILADGGVQHSTDGGSTWQTESTGVTVTLTAGASPSPAVCWLVGPGGIVLLSVNARPWQRIAFPDAIDLVAIVATDDKHATVTASDRRALRTTDGGVTWTP